MLKKIRKPGSFLLLIFLMMGVLLSTTMLDRPVEFNDINFEFAIREKFNNFGKPIFRSQLLPIVELDLSHNNIQNIEGINHFRNLEELILRGNHIVDVAPLATLTNLRVLDLGNSQIVDLEAINFDHITHLQLIDLSLDQNVIDNENREQIRLSNISLLGELTSLKYLNLANNHIVDIDSLEYLLKLEYLNLANNQLTDLNGLENLNRLEKLNLRENQLEDITAISQLQNLKYLNLHSNSNITDVSAIKDLVHLEVLIMRNVPIGEQIDVLENMTRLQRLNIRNCSVSDVSFLIALMQNSALQDQPEKNIYTYLDILENNIPDDPNILRGFRPYWDNIHEKYPFTLNDGILDPLVFSVERGHYHDPFFLELETGLSNVSIHYTLDGSRPTRSSQIYTDPIPIDRQDPVLNRAWNSTVVRTRLFKDDGYDASPIITHTYFIGEDIFEFSSLPVISLVSDPQDFFGIEKGIYYHDNRNERGKKWERNVHLELFEPDGLIGLTQEALIRIHGGISRGFPQRSLRLYGENNYDTFEPLDYAFFPVYTATGTGEQLTQYKTLILRNSGNDWHFSMFKDAMVQSLYAHTSQDIQAYQPVITFINGKYWGIYNIRERFDEFYIERHYNIDPNDVIMHEINFDEDFYGQPVDENEFLKFIDFIQHNDVNDEGVYDYITTQIDIENFIENQIIYLYTVNGDWLWNNVNFWRKNVDVYDPNAQPGHDGLWRWMVVDMDISFELINVELNWIPYASRSNEKATALLNSLIKHPQFRIDFINQFADHINTTFLPSRVIDVINMHEANLEPVIDAHINRWESQINTKDQWLENIDEIRTFALLRHEIVRQHLIETFNLTGTFEIHLQTDTVRGHVQVNKTNILETTPGVADPSAWSGIYFADIPITLTAFPNPGYTFSHWEGLPTEDYDSDSISIVSDENLRIIAIFKPISAD